jgi:hypothetical protein
VDFERAKFLRRGLEAKRRGSSADNLAAADVLVIAQALHHGLKADNYMVLDAVQNIRELLAAQKLQCAIADIIKRVTGEVYADHQTAILKLIN